MHGHECASNIIRRDHGGLIKWFVNNEEGTAHCSIVDRLE